MLKQKLVASGSDACVAFVSSDDRAKVCPVSCAFRCDSTCTYREFCVFEYAQINVGEPHLHMYSTATRGKATICLHVMIDEGQASAGYRDLHCVNVTPSVNLMLDVKARSSNEDVGEISKVSIVEVCAYTLAYTQLPL